MRDEAGRIVRWYGTCTDIDDQKRAETAAEEANLAKNRFLAVLSHELRTPLTPILLSVSAMLDDGSLAAEVRASLEMIRRNVALESRLIDDLLDLTRILRGTFALEPEPSDAHALIGPRPGDLPRRPRRRRPGGRARPRRGLASGPGRPGAGSSKSSGTC